MNRSFHAHHIMNIAHVAMKDRAKTTQLDKLMHFDYVIDVVAPPPSMSMDQQVDMDVASTNALFTQGKLPMPSLISAKPGTKRSAKRKKSTSSAASVSDSKSPSSKQATQTRRGTRARPNNKNTNSKGPE
jgi:hypothetical protein